MNTPIRKKLGILPLTLLVVGSIVGSGIFSLPQNMAEGSGTGAILIAWVITLFGMFMLTRIFQYLSIRFYKINDGLYGYVREGFGDYIGFNAAWGYWISAWMSCTSYLVILFSALGSFDCFNFFGHGTTLPAIITAIVFLWIVHYFVLKGIYRAFLLNCLVTLAKIVPIGLFIVCVSLAFKISTFKVDFWGSPQLGSIIQQVENTMLYTVWVYLGIESATVYAARAKNMISISRATFFGFAITSLLLVCVSVLSLGIVPQQELAQMKNPSMALVIEHVIGSWGATLINIGLIVSVSGGLLSWLMLAAEMLFLSGQGKQHTVPSFFGKLNKAGTPANALWLTTSLITVLIILAHFYQSGYNTLIQLSTSMVLIPYLLSALFVFKLAIKQSNAYLIMIGACGSLYGIWLIYAGGVSYLLLSMILYSVGLLFYLYARKERSLSAFSYLHDKVYAIVIITLALIAIIYFYILPN
ncbi:MULTISPECIES: basic amino acid/polyamine antiporter [unclassified Gilliamella]|uniref:basic amino acid/polyamine antiporter n=1 Tax=unclassified Gilliamella TaxID=2685620 RepID=UPI001322BB33|nr:MULTISPECIES: basic amino acid/polyamine antiporter [unclassified Gilliamella]MWN31120.1 amino acid permease [Gilliamella sp. Pra-s60]MWP28315.1 amino acid permease [Gilliamella sp. Pra-s54]